MPRFKKFISESILNERDNAKLNSDLIYQKVLDVLDNAHIDFDERKISFHIGRIIKSSSIDLYMTIRPASAPAVRLGQKGEDLYIVVDTDDKLPVRSEIDSFLSKDRERAAAIKSCITKYLREYHNTDKTNTKTRYEEERSTNDKTHFEAMYEKLVAELHDRLDEYKEAVEEINSQMDTENAGVRETGKAALRHLTKEYFGENLEEFKKIAMGILDTDYGGKSKAYQKQLTKENKQKLENRLDSFYDQKIKPMVR